MNLLDITRRTSHPDPWSEGEKIPWHDPSFSARMLQEHLSQEHNAASRRVENIDRQVAWIHENLLSGSPARILDLGCGPGLYTHRFAGYGHHCTGIDFSPASIDYANQQNTGDNPIYRQADIRYADYGKGYDLVMLIFGEFNTFRPADARLILTKAHAALKLGGLLLLEPHTYDAVREIGEQPATWSSAESGLFSDRPHLLLHECFWQAEAQVAVRRWFVIDAASGSVHPHADSMQAYTNAQYRQLLSECEYDAVEFYSSMAGDGYEQAGLMAISARKPGS